MKKIKKKYPVATIKCDERRGKEERRKEKKELEEEKEMKIKDEE